MVMIKKNYKGYISIFFFCTIISCSTKEETNKMKNNTIGNEKFIITKGQNSKEIVFNFKRIIPNEKSRKWIKMKVNSKFKIGGIKNELFLTPTNVRTDKLGNIYVLDNMDGSVKKFDESGKFIRKFGSKGEGPAEFSNAFSFDITKDGKVAIISDNDNKFVIFDDKNFIDYKTKLMPGRICFISSDEVVTFQLFDPFSHSVFKKTNIKSLEETNYQNILNKDSFDGGNFGMLPLLVGDIHSYHSHYMVYISQVMGYIVLYDKNGTIIKAFNLINKKDKTDLYENERINNLNASVVNFPKFEEELFLKTHVFGDNLFVLEILGERNLKNYIEKLEEQDYFVDIYSLKDCDYKFSVLLKDFGGIKTVYFTDTDLYMVKENTEIEVFEYQFEDVN
jgi:hypothetical protein